MTQYNQRPRNTIRISTYEDKVKALTFASIQGVTDAKLGNPAMSPIVLFPNHMGEKSKLILSLVHDCYNLAYDTTYIKLKQLKEEEVQ